MTKAGDRLSEAQRLEAGGRTALIRLSLIGPFGGVPGDLLG